MFSSALPWLFGWFRSWLLPNLAVSFHVYNSARKNRMVTSQWPYENVVSPDQNFYSLSFTFRVLRHCSAMFHCSVKIYIFSVRIQVVYIFLCLFGKLFWVNYVLKQKGLSYSVLTTVLKQSKQYDWPMYHWFFFKWIRAQMLDKKMVWKTQAHLLSVIKM